MRFNFLSVLFAAPVAFAMLATGCAVEPDTDESTGESEDHLLAGRRLTTGEIAADLRAAGFPESAVGPMVCTAKYESSYYERASNHNTNGTYDYGLFQINSIHLKQKGCPSTSAGLYDAEANAKCAYAVWKSQGLNAWYGYQKHRTECNATKAPASSSSSSSSSSSGGTSSGSTDAGGCYSSTLDDHVDALTCVESKHDDIWYQCYNGVWLSGVHGSTGPKGACASVHPL